MFHLSSPRSGLDGRMRPRFADEYPSHVLPLAPGHSSRVLPPVRILRPAGEGQKRGSPDRAGAFRLQREDPDGREGAALELLLDALLDGAAAMVNYQTDRA